MELDVYARDVSRIIITDVFRISVTKRVRGSEIRVMGLEALLIARMRASRPQDIQDLHELCKRLGKNVKWNAVAELAKPEEIAQLKTVVSLYV